MTCARPRGRRSRPTSCAASARRWTGCRPGVGTGGRGAAGIAEVLDALNQARVETLLIAENFQIPGRVDFQAGLLLPEGRDEGEPVDNIVEPAIEKAIEQSANAMVVRHHTDLEPIGGIGAVLALSLSESRVPRARASWARRWRATSRPRGMRSVPGTGPPPRPKGWAPRWRPARSRRSKAPR